MAVGPLGCNRTEKARFRNFKDKSNKTFNVYSGVNNSKLSQGNVSWILDLQDLLLIGCFNILKQCFNDK